MAIIFLLFWGNSAQALKVIEHNRFHIYFPDGEYALADSLAAACEPMAAFLKSHGLQIILPLHIILDDALDQPAVSVSMIPHREIRIPLKAPGVLEEGSNEADPWRYFLFLGLCAQGIYSERSGIPASLHLIFGEIVSPNIILPDWGVEGIGHLLYEKYIQRESVSPLAEAIFNAGPVPDLDKVSNHPEIWPGRYSHKIYGRPFIRWLDQRYGWESLLSIIRLHGAGIVPFEIDGEARAVFGQDWTHLWETFQKDHDLIQDSTQGLFVVGFWPDPFIYWNDLGVQPGLSGSALRGRYGYIDDQGWLRLSIYDGKGIARLQLQRGDALHTLALKHVWDPGPGGVAVTRRGHRPQLVLNPQAPLIRWFDHAPTSTPGQTRIAAPKGVIQLSGPVMDPQGRIVVAGNTEGNWDIWLYDGAWQRLTDSPSIEIDPWMENGQLLFASNITGRFQIHTFGMRQITFSPTAAILPRHTTCLQLNDSGWERLQIPTNDLPTSGALPLPDPAQTATPQAQAVPETAGPYSMWDSIWPNYIAPDLFIDTNDVQLGIATQSRDVSGAYAWDAGVRYSSENEFFSWRLGAKAHNWISRATRYPFGYTTARHTTVNETRYDLKLGYLPFETDALELSANWRYYMPEAERDPSEDEWWGSISYRYVFSRLNARATLDWFTYGNPSLYGEAEYRMGERIKTILHLQAGKTWGDIVPGHDSFRIGGNAAEGFFTHRPTRLFPLRGFEDNILDAGQAAAAGIETIWPLARLQAGYKTFPLFLRNVNLGTFIDAGFAASHFNREELLVSAGFEFITGLELAWNFNANFRIGLAWPLQQPDDLNQSGPVLLVQIGRPL